MSYVWGEEREEKKEHVSGVRSRLTRRKGPVNSTDGAAEGSGGARGSITAGASDASTSSPGGTSSSGTIATGISALAMLLALGTAVSL